MNDQETRASGLPTDEAGMLALLEAAQLLQERIERALEGVGLSWAKFSLLSILLEAGEPLPLGEVAGRAHCVRSNVTQLIDRLASDGLVRRGNDPADRRVVRAELTPLGREQALAGASRMEEVRSAFAASLAEEDRAALIRVLAALR